MTTRLSVNVNDETADALRELADDGETSVTEIVRRVVGFYSYVTDAAVDGYRLEVVTPGSIFRGDRRVRVEVL